MALAAPSDDRFVMVGGPSGETLPLDEIAKALATGAGKLRTEPKMAALLASVDRTRPVWAVAKMTETYRTVDLFAPFDTVTLTGDRQGDVFRLKLVARGVDAEKVKAAVETFEAGRREAIEGLKDEGARVPFMKDIIAFVESMKTDVAGGQVTLTASYKGGPMSFLALPMMMGTVRSTEMRREARDAEIEPPR